MAYKYQLKEYVQQGYNFNAIFPQKVEEVQNMTGMLFSVQDIVDYVQKQTNDFKIENPVAKDLDAAIYRLILKFDKKSEIPEPDDSSSVEEWAESAEALYDLLMSGEPYDASTIEEWKDALDALVSLLENENFDAATIKKYKSIL
jgi:hypothetical protein